MTTFIHNVADELLRRFGWEGLKHVTLVFPMHRAGVVMRSELQRRMAAEHPSAVWAPQIMALGDLFDSLCPLGKEDELFTVCRLHRIYSECLEGEPMDIDRFYGWGRQLLSDFTNIDQGISEAEIDSFFRNSLALSDLDRYKLDEEVRHRLVDLLYKGDARRQEAIAESVQAHFAALWHALPDIYHRLRDELQQAGKGYDGQRMRYVISHWQQLSPRAESRMYCFIGFNYLLPVERQLMQLLKDEERALFFWDYVEDFRTNTKAFAFIRQNIRLLPNALPAATWGQPRKIKTITATSVHSEAEYAGQWLQQTYWQHGEQTAVVICDESQLEPVIYSLPAIRLDGSDTPEQVNITKGYPLRHAPVYVAVIKALDKSFRNHPGDCISALQEVVKTVDGLSKQSLQLKQDTWQWHMERESLYQTRRALLQFITILRDQTVQTLAGQPDLLRRLIMRHMEQITLPFHGEPITDLQVMGVLETRTLDFNHLLLLNVEEGVIPAHQPDKSFLPYYLRKAYGLQTHDERASVYAYNFFRLLQRAEDVTIVFSQSQTSMTKKSMSRFVMQMLVCPEEFEVTKFTLTESNTLQPAKTIEVPEGTDWVSARRAKGKRLSLSPSAIGTFYTCKRKFYLNYILGLDEEDEQEVIFSNRTLGLFVHEAVHYLYEHHCHCDGKSAKKISPNQVEQLNTPEKRFEALEHAYRRLNDTYKTDHEGAADIYFMDQHAMENRVIDKYIERVLDRDRYDAEHCGLTILMLEQPIYTTISLPLSEESDIKHQTSDIKHQTSNIKHQTSNIKHYASADGQKADLDISVGGIVDRMDKIGGLGGLPEVTRIVDYKCGKFVPAKMSAHSEDLCTPGKKDTDYVRQTMLYSFVAYDQRLSLFNEKEQPSGFQPHLYFTSQDLMSADTQTRVKLDGNDMTCDENTNGDYRSLIERMLTDIVSEREFVQCQECSPYCPFLNLCGRQAQEY